MYALRQYARLAFVVAALFAFLTSLHNVYGDNAELIPVAKYEACPGSLCGMRQLERTPFAQVFHFATPKDETIIVRCTRSAIFVGEYACARE